MHVSSSFIPGKLVELNLMSAGYKEAGEKLPVVIIDVSPIFLVKRMGVSEGGGRWEK